MLKLCCLSLWLVLFQWTTLQDDKIVLVELGESQPRFWIVCRWLKLWESWKTIARKTRAKNKNFLPNRNWTQQNLFKLRISLSSAQWDKFDKIVQRRTKLENVNMYFRSWQFSKTFCSNQITCGMVGKAQFSLSRIDVAAESADLETVFIASTPKTA